MLLCLLHQTLKFFILSRVIRIGKDEAHITEQVGYALVNAVVLFLPCVLALKQGHHACDCVALLWRRHHLVQICL